MAKPGTRGDPQSPWNTGSVGPSRIPGAHVLDPDQARINDITVVPLPMLKSRRHQTHAGKLGDATAQSLPYAAFCLPGIAVRCVHVFVKRPHALPGAIK